MNNNLPSRFQIGDKVDINFYDAGKLRDGFIVSIRFSENKTFYNIAIQTVDNLLTQIEDVDSVFVEPARKRTEEILRN